MEKPLHITSSYFPYPLILTYCGLKLSKLYATAYPEQWNMSEICALCLAHYNRSTHHEWKLYRH